MLERNKLGFSWLLKGEIGGSRGPESTQDLVFLREQGIRALIRMAGTAAAAELSTQVKRLGLADHHDPVPDFTAPSLGQVQRMVSFAQDSVAKGLPVGISCTAGLGRSGTVLACYLVAKGTESADTAIREVRHARPGSIETESQAQIVAAFQEFLRPKTGRRLETVRPSRLTPLVSGRPASSGIGVGPVCVIHKAEHLGTFRDGDVLVAEATPPEYVGAMKRAAAVVTDKGGRTCSAAIVSKELGVPCVVGAEQATRLLRPGTIVTVDGASGNIYEGNVADQISNQPPLLAP